MSQPGGRINNNNGANNSGAPTKSAGSTTKTPSASTRASAQRAARPTSTGAASAKQLESSLSLGSKEATRASSSSGDFSASAASLHSSGPRNNSNAGSRPTSSASRVTPPPSAAGSTSGSQRLSSVDILNENRQRQLQFKQQESFKQHLEQRQKFIQQQQREASADDEASVAYQVNTSAPEYYMAANRPAPATSGAARAQSGGLALNPFDEQQRASDKAATLSGKSGFLAALMDEASFEPTPAAGQADDEELDSGERAKATGLEGTRYAKVATGGLSYNYDDQAKKPFYERDLATLLQECRSSRKLVIVIVAIALLLDNMLLTSVVPIIPAHLYKLRIERQHRELLARNKSLYLERARARQGAMADEELSEEELHEAELNRRINQSLANVKDRFSGSVFHPRIRPDQLERAKQRQRDDHQEDDDDDDDDDNAQASRSRQRTRPRFKEAAASGRRGDGSQRTRDDDDDDDDRDSPADDDKETSSERKGSPTREQSGRAKSAGRRTNVNTPGGMARGGARPKGKQKQAAGQVAGGEDDDDDDEDLADARRYTEIRSTLASMAKSRGNSSDLGGMCLNMVLNDMSKMRMSTDNQDDNDNNDDEKDDDSMSSDRNKADLKKPVGDVNDDGKDEDDDDDDEQDDREVAKDKKKGQRPRGRGQSNMAEERQAKFRPSRSPRIRQEPKVIRPKPRQQTDEEAKQAAKDAELEAKEAALRNEDEPVISHQDIVDESFEVGVMFASKPIVQAFANPFIGTLTNKVGFTVPMFTGFVIMFLSTLVFAFGNSYSTLFIARAIQGVGSACTSVAGMSMLADRFPDDAERGNAMAVALGGLALGVVIGPPFGGFMYEFIGKSSPFIVLSILALLDGLLQLMVLQPRVTENQEEGASLMTLIKDPYILVAAGAITFANTGIAILEPALPLWMMDTMQAKNWEQGVAFLPAALSYMFGTNLFGNLGLKIGRWRATMIGLIIIGCSLLLIPFAKSVDHLIIPNGAIGFAMGMVDSTMMPMLGYLVDIRHTSVYGSVYAIGDVAFCASFAFGPALSGTLVRLVGFEGLIITTALICFGFAPLLLLLRNPPPRQVSEAQLQEQSTLRYVNYSHLDSPDEEAQLTGDYRATAKTYVK